MVDNFWVINLVDYFRNMNELYKKKCVPCKGDIPPFTREQINEYLKYLEGWNAFINQTKAFYLSKVYTEN